jgi:DNA-binding beta-propeller fold protein YncE
VDIAANSVEEVQAGVGVEAAWACSRVSARAVSSGWCFVRWGVVVLCVLFGVCLVGVVPAWGLSQRGHVFAFGFGGRGAGEGEFDAPSAVAVNQSNGDVYVADYLNNRVEVFEPELAAGGALVGERYAGSFVVSGPEGVAVDSSTGASDPSRGDVYVVGSDEHELRSGEPDKRVFKFSAAGTQIAVLRSFKEPVEGGRGSEESEEFEEVQGLAVDPAGDLYVYSAGSVDVFDSAAKKNKGLFSVPAPSRATRGFALTSEGDFYAGHESENPEAVGPEGALAVIGEFEGLTGTALVSEVDEQSSSAVAVNTEDEPANGVDELDDVYVANVAGTGEGASSTVAQFAPGGSLLQRFTAPGLEEASGVAVDEQTGSVFVGDAASDVVDVFALEPAGPPTVDSLSSQVLPSSSSVSGAIELQARIDPVGSDTRYQFEYGTGSCSETPSQCSRTAETDIGEGFGAQLETLELQDLPPGSYHYRVTASNSHGSVESREQAFAVVSPTVGLPDGRAWEMVTPTDKHGIPVEPLTREGGLILASEDGNSLAYLSDGALTQEPQGNRAPEPQQLLSKRGAGGWSTEDIASPNASAKGLHIGAAPEYQFFTPDLSQALVNPFSPSSFAEPPLAPGVTQATPYLRNNLTDLYTPLISEANTPAGTRFGGKVNFLSATADLSHVVLSSTVALTQGGPSSGLYEWVGGELYPVSELPDGAAAKEPELGFHGRATASALSSDGTRVIWTTPEQATRTGHLYMRDTASGETLQLDAAQGVGEPDVGSAEFQTASVDGSRVFFTDKQRLTADSTAEPGSAQEAGESDLYECEVTTVDEKLSCVLKDLTVDPNGEEHAAVQGLLLGSSEDGSSLYLVAHGVLATNTNSNAAQAVPGSDNLYALHFDASRWTTSFIGVLSREDSVEWEGNQQGDPAFLTARASPNGRYLAFMSNASLTGYDNTDVTPASKGAHDEEVYIYDAQTAQLRCVSCDPDGARPTGVLDTLLSGEGAGLLVDRRLVWEGHWLAGSVPGWTAQSLTSAIYQPRYLSDEGRLFFDSPEELTGEAKNAKDDVYEYEPEGVGSCQPASGGCVSLISSGSSHEESAFLEATPSGNDVFFLTASPLVAQDTDDEDDIYDARVCTQASPCLTPAATAPPECNTADGCRPTTTGPPPATSGSGSATFTGPGNLSPTLSAAKQAVKGSKTSSKALTNEQKLAKALKACRTQHSHSKQKRKACEAHARKLYAPKRKAGKK